MKCGMKRAVVINYINLFFPVNVFICLKKENDTALPLLQAQIKRMNYEWSKSNISLLQRRALKNPKPALNYAIVTISERGQKSKTKQTYST